MNHSIVDHLDEKDPARDFVEERVQALQDWLASPSAQAINGIEPIDLTLKAIPMLNVGWNSETIDINSILTSEFWSKLPGDFGIVIKIQTTATIGGKSYRVQG